jgi:DNA-3-methyladenine glycosylase I
MSGHYIIDEVVMKRRCAWVKLGNQDYESYHDNEWGEPVHDDQKHFEMLILEGAQAGLSWETILKRRAAYRAVFHQFNPQKVAAMLDLELEQLLTNPGIIRNRLKVYSTRENARIFLAIQQEFSSFDAYVWRFVNHKIKFNCPETIAEVPTSTAESLALSKDLQKRGMRFVGPTIMYAYMQAIGMVNDHMKNCFKGSCD